MPATKDQIADAFLRHVQRYGYGKASVEDVAAELGISKRTVYQRFSGKSDIYAYVVDRIADAERDRLVALVAGAGSHRAKMEAFLREVVTTMRTHIQETEKADWMQEFAVARDAMARAYGSIVTRLVADGNAAGEFEFDDPDFANELVGAMVTHYGVLIRDRGEWNADEALVAAIMRMLGGPAPAKKRKG